LIPEGVEVSVTRVFGGNVAEHVPPTTPAVITQLMPDGELAMVPVPEPPPLMTSPCVLKITSAVRPCDIATWHGSVVQSPAHPLNTALPVVDCCSVTTVL